MAFKNNPKNNEGVLAIVDEALPNAMFRVTVEGEDEQKIAYLSGKMRIHRIRVLVGDKVLLKLDEYGGKPRIIKRI